VKGGRSVRLIICFGGAKPVRNYSKKRTGGQKSPDQARKGGKGALTGTNWGEAKRAGVGGGGAGD